ncbi:hypothetical protein CA54_28170 [Symmachiella macrocystis]|uniref:DUF3299 domain-containing protein n=1 Tax=Symmachiella macrocystis TaxID=2527985 RepID=A0A5C6BPL7_9PLAN|nr:hypothetical protein [Symmachiella macrocystis]TWU13975.1 hypothetical protein CA54_28170 [Symmachiella macrocystis]
MKSKRCAAQSIGLCMILVTGAGLLSGCGKNPPDKPLLTIDSSEMQSTLAELEAEKQTAAEATSPTESTAAEQATKQTADQAAPIERPPALFASKNPPEDPSLQLATASTAPDASATNTANFPPTAANTLPNGMRPEEITGEDPSELIPAEPREVKLLIPDKSFQKVEPDGALRVSYDDVDLLKILNMDPVSLDAPDLMPKWLKDLDGKRIRLRGFMYPPFSDTENPSFILARDNEICCFGRNPKPYDVIQIVMRKGVTTKYIQNRPFDVVGTFHIEMLTYDDKKVDGLYLIDDAIVMDR